MLGSIKMLIFCKNVLTPVDYRFKYSCIAQLSLCCTAREIELMSGFWLTTQTRSIVYHSSLFLLKTFFLLSTLLVIVKNWYILHFCFTPSFSKPSEVDTPQRQSRLTQKTWMSTPLQSHTWSLVPTVGLDTVQLWLLQRKVISDKMLWCVYMCKCAHIEYSYKIQRIVYKGLV